MDRFLIRDRRTAVRLGKRVVEERKNKLKEFLKHVAY
jgi:hypothetical protein